MFGAGADLGFSRGGGEGRGGRIFKILSTFFLGRPNWFSELCKRTKKFLLMPKFLRRAGKILKKQPEKAFLGTFWNFFNQKFAFFRRGPPFKISIENF